MTTPSYWSGEEWTAQRDYEDGDFNEGQPTGGHWARANRTEDALSLELYTPRFPKERAENAMWLADGAEFSLGLVFLRVGDAERATSRDGHGILSYPHDTWPGDGYTPHGHDDPSTWIRLRMAEAPG